MRRLLLLSLSCLMASALPARGASPPRNATGMLTVAGEATPLSFAYATTIPAPGGGDERRIFVVLSDVPLSEKDRFDEYALRRLSVQGKMRGVDAMLLPDGTPDSGRVYHKVFGDAEMEGSGFHRFEAKAIEEKTIEGRLYLTQPYVADDKPWQFDVTFQATVEKTPKSLARKR